MPMRRREPEDRKVQLLKAALAALAETGIEQFTMAEVARRADVSPALVVHYFGDRDKLIEATFRQLVERVTTLPMKALAGGEEPEDRLRAFVLAHLNPGELSSESSRAWLSFWGLALYTPALARLQRVHQERMVSNLKHELRALVVPDAVNRIAETIAALIDGFWLRAALAGAWKPDVEIPVEWIFEAIDRDIATARLPATGAMETNSTFDTLNPATGEVLATITIDGKAEVDKAVGRAAEAQKLWARTPGVERGRILNRAAQLLTERNESIARLEAQDTGKPIQETIAVDVLSGADAIEYFAGIARTLSGEHFDLGPGAFGYTRREPLGVVAGIGAWNYPIQIACWKSAPALACGNAMIFKPAELTPLTAIELEKAYRDAGLPDGLFQVVQGKADTGRLLSRHPGIAKVSLTGEVGTGKKVMADASATLKVVTLELGGKSALIVFEDADLDEAVSGALLANFYSAGEVCTNGTRVFVHRKVRDQFLTKLKARTEAMVVGDPLDPATQMGALISQAHMEKVLGYIELGQQQGATLLTGGKRVTRGDLAKGAFVEPTIFTQCTDDMAIVREEIFGPVMSVLDFEEEAEVVARANDTDLGLAAGIFTNDLTRAHRVIAALEAGTCWINTYNVTPIELPFGGNKQSGLGRENGKAAIEYFTQLKSVYVAMEPIDAPY
ncbi:betaine-aldehyde dehydrogenase [Novosphingobium sp.]|uniref:betaine-aldehyde dehydrogenase n=2 Tax=unclassified Novosphingobium TaxID=2644732 RepID=UPI000EC41A9B|nr:betaine-aldehyde dehydrogenase [Novosphingobium sp.]HCF24798.1 betaine-aldehyde dehydrogenase [Novosphingobium sp.]